MLILACSTTTPNGIPVGIWVQPLRSLESATSNSPGEYKVQTGNGLGEVQVDRNPLGELGI
jgi:hypothetical protein